MAIRAGRTLDPGRDWSGGGACMRKWSSAKTSADRLLQPSGAGAAMMRILLSQRVDSIPSRGETRDAVDRRWIDLLHAAGILAIAAPNYPEIIPHMIDDLSPEGILLTGGNNLTAYGGDTPERDETESILIRWALDRKKPVLGVCRGTQMLLHYFGGRLRPVEGHAGARNRIRGVLPGLEGKECELGCYHDFGFFEKDMPEALEPLAYSPDGCVEAFRHRQARILAIMWHPEREAAYRNQYTQFLRDYFRE